MEMQAGASGDGAIATDTPKRIRNRRVFVAAVCAALVVGLVGGGYGVYRWWKGPDLRLRDGRRYAAVLKPGDMCASGVRSWYVNIDGPTRYTFQSNYYSWTIAAPAPASLGEQPVAGTLLVVHDWGRPAAYFEARGTKVPLDGGSEYGRGPASAYDC